ncbi:MAG: heme exporter protein CcmB [Deltaproteobacteria bacterium]|nr:heme exporter protein CcmB [Deltaproteobacteria bacterium]
MFKALLRKEWILITRNPESVVLLPFFSFLLILIFYFGLPAEGRGSHQQAAAILWLATLFGGVLRLGRTYEAENEGGILSLMSLIPGIAQPFFLSKFLVNFLFILALELVLFFLTLIIFNLTQPVDFLSKGALPFAAGAFGFACVGTTFSGMFVGHSRRELLLPVILYPILVPLIFAVMKSFVYDVGGQIMGLDPAWIKILLGFDLVFLIASWMVFDRMMTEC